MALQWMSSARPNCCCLPTTCCSSCHHATMMTASSLTACNPFSHCNLPAASISPLSHSHTPSPHAPARHSFLARQHQRVERCAVCCLRLSCCLALPAAHTAPPIPPRVAAGPCPHQCGLQGVHGEGLHGGLPAAAFRAVAAAVLPWPAPAEGQRWRLQGLLDAPARRYASCVEDS